MVGVGERGRNGHRVEGVTGEREESGGWKAGAGAMGAPLVHEETGIGVDVAVGGRIAWAGLG